MGTPRVSIIIPNFDNGRASSLSGRDLLGELFASLERTLRDETTSFEIVVADDGSTDDSLATCRAWAAKRWPDGRPFLRLIELEHSGVLSAVLNRLERESVGEFLARLDGDIVLRTDRWLTPLVAMFEAEASLGVVTATQLLPDGTVHAFGDDLWGPRGYRHIGRGAPLASLPAEREVDHAMGCFYMTRRAVHASIGGYDEEVLRGQTEEYGVRVRLAGWRVKATSRVLFEHWHTDRLPRANRADRAESLDASLERFRSRWGFDRLAPDLAHVRARYAGTPLWWRDHARFGLDADADDWTRLAHDGALANRLRDELDLLGRVLDAANGAAPAVIPVTIPVMMVGSGAGLLALTLARRGIRVTGVERDGAAHRAAHAALERLVRAGDSAVERAVTFTAVDDLGSLPVPDRSAPLVTLFGTLERAWNPVGLLREARRIVTEGGAILLRTALRSEPWDDPDELGHRMTADEILTLLRHVGGLTTFGAQPRLLARDGEPTWFEAILRATPIERGRGYFSRPVEPRTASLGA